METNQKSFIVTLLQSNTARLIMVGLLTLFLLIPLELVKNLVSERKYRQAEVISEINSKWGNEVFFYGPILKVPYTTYVENEVHNPKTNAVFDCNNVTMNDF